MTRGAVPRPAHSALVRPGGPNRCARRYRRVADARGALRRAAVVLRADGRRGVPADRRRSAGASIGSPCRAPGDHTRRRSAVHPVMTGSLARLSGCMTPSAMTMSSSGVRRRHPGLWRTSSRAWRRKGFQRSAPPRTQAACQAAGSSGQDRRWPEKGRRLDRTPVHGHTGTDARERGAVTSVHPGEPALLRPPGVDGALTG